MDDVNTEKYAVGGRKALVRAVFALVVMALAMAWTMTGGVGTARADIVAPTNYTQNGSSITWSIDDAGTLHIAPTSGNRGVLKYNTNDTGTTAPPWYSQRARIKSVETAGLIELQGSTYSMFNSCSSLTSINLSNFDTSKVTDMTGMFSSCDSLTSLDLSSFDTSQVTRMSQMFHDCYALTSLDLSNFDTSNVTSMSSMFSGCKSLTSLDLSNFDTSGVTNMAAMFYDCYSLTYLNLSGFDTSKVTDMGNMFDSCFHLTSLDVSSFDTSNVTDMRYIFNSCYTLTSLDLSPFNTSNITNMSGMFNGCTKITSLDISSFDTSNVTTMYSMFDGCSSLTSLDLSSFDTSKVTRMASMFSSCKSLTSLDLSNFDTSNVTDMYGMFYNCSSLASLDVSHFDTSKVTSMSSMFGSCKSLASLDVSSFDTSNVTDMQNMFNGCRALTSLDLSNFNNSNVTNMSNMLYQCSSLDRVKLGANNPFVGKTASVTASLNGSWTRQDGAYGPIAGSDMATSYDGSEMAGLWIKDKNFAVYDSSDNSLKFYNAATRRTFGPTATQTLYYGWDTTTWTAATMQPWNAVRESIETVEVVDEGISPSALAYWFSGCKNLRAADLSKLTTSRVENMSWMFSGCTSLTSLDLSGFDTSNVTNMYRMFPDCNSLTSLDLSGFDTSNVTNMNQVFTNCTSLTSLDISGFDTSKVTNMGSMFFNCSSLTSLDLSNFNTSNVTRMDSMFSNCSSLTSLDLSSFDTSKVTNMDSMFSRCSKLKSVDLADTFSFKGKNISSTRNQALLPTPTGDEYTGKWIRSDESSGPYTPTQLRNNYSSEMAGTWVWEVKDGHAVVAYDANGGQCALQTDGCEAGGTVTLPEATRYGYLFQGWTAAEDGSGEKLAAGTAYTPADGKTTILHAQWEADPRVGYTVRTYKQRSDLSGYDLAETKSYEYAALPEAMWTVEPEDIKGFVTPAAQTQQLAEGGATVFDLYYDRTRWTVAYYGNGADGGWMASQAMVGGVPAELSPNNFTRTGHLFAGWNTEADGSGNSYLDGQRVVDEAGDGQALELFAQWIELEGDPQATQGTYTVRLKGGESVEFVGVPAGTVYEVSESSMPRGWEQTGSDGSEGTVSANSRSQATVTNSYSASGEFSVTAHKRLSGGNLEPGEFSFELVDEHGNVVETVANGEVDERDMVEGPDGESEVANAHKGSAPVEFSPVKVTAAGTYRYKVREVRGGDSTIDYDASVFPVTVTAADAGHGNLACTVSFDGGDDTFDNAVKPASLKVSKSASGATSASSGQRFSFDVDVRDAAGNAVTAGAHLETAAADVPSGITSEGYTQASGSAVGEGDAVTFDANGGYFADGDAALNVVTTRGATVAVSHTENVADDGKKESDYGNSWTNSSIRGTGRESASSQAHVVTVPGSQQLTVDLYYNGESTNYDWASVWAGSHPNYTAASNYSSTGKATTAMGAPDNNNKFGGSQSGSFEVNGNALSYMGHCTLTVPGDTVTFAFKSDGSGYGKGYGYYAVVRGSLDVTGGAYYEPLPPSSGKAFAGWYTTPECTDGSEFDWEHYESEGGAKLKVYAKWADAPQTTSADVQVVGGRVTVELAAGESCTLSGLPAGATYAVAEREAAGWKQIEAQGAQGTLAAGETASASFSNRYSTSGSWAPSVTKSVTGPDAHMEAGEYSFAMADDDGQVVATGSNDENGNVAFTAVPLEASDDGVERVYRVYEVEGSDEAIEYDSHVAVFTVTPRDDGQGHMTADVSVQGATEFVNTFRAAEVDMPMTGAGLGGLVALAALGGALAAWSLLRRRGASREEE